MKAPREETPATRSRSTWGGSTVVCAKSVRTPATITKKQKTLNCEMQEVEFLGTGRHDPCVLPRAVPIVEAMTALVLCDHYLRQKVLSGC